MTRTCYDSTTASDIPANAEMVAGYVNGAYRWSETDWGRFLSTTVRVTVTVTIDADAMVLDVETGDATPEQAPGWVNRQRSLGHEPTVYCNASTWAAVKVAFIAQRIVEPSYWIAQYDGVTVIPEGAVAKQYADPATSGGHYDASVVVDFWPGVDQMSAEQLAALLAKSDALGYSIMVYLARQQRGLDVLTGKPFVPTQEDPAQQVPAPTS